MERETDPGEVYDPSGASSQKGATMFEDSVIAEKDSRKKSDEELLRELADLVANQKRDEKLGFMTFPGDEERISGILNNLGYAVP